MFKTKRKRLQKAHSYRRGPLKTPLPSDAAVSGTLPVKPNTKPVKNKQAKKD
jgi:hypothetical protein